MIDIFDWQTCWHAYQGRVRVILEQGEVAYGDATGTAEWIQDPRMAVDLDMPRNGATRIWVHPQHVAPVSPQGENLLGTTRDDCRPEYYR